MKAVGLVVCVLCLPAFAQQAAAPAAVVHCLGSCAKLEIAFGPDATLFEATCRAQPGTEAALDRVMLVRFGATDFLVNCMDVEKAIKTGKLDANNVVVAPGDLIVIPRRDGKTLAERDKAADVDAALQVIAAAPIGAQHRVEIACFRMLHHPDVRQRPKIAFDLGMMGPAADKAVPQLIRALQLEPELAREAVTALGMIGPAASAAIPALKELTGRDDKQLRERAVAALRAIEQPSPQSKGRRDE